MNERRTKLVNKIFNLYDSASIGVLEIEAIIDRN